MKTASREESSDENEKEDKVEEEKQEQDAPIEQIQEVRVIPSLGDFHGNCPSPDIDAAGLFSDIHDMN